MGNSAPPACMQTKSGWEVFFVQARTLPETGMDKCIPRILHLKNNRLDHEKSSTQIKGLTGINGEGFPDLVRIGAGVSGDSWIWP